ncbi:MAG TPA: hypothetical protein VHG28_22590 [Longimicrobiaceae bacterium]|nr:hypothetical protein [Longimicrobiaceae bacterium]
MTRRALRDGALPLLVLACVGWGAPARAQLPASPFSVGARVFAAEPTDREDGPLERGTGFGVDAGYTLRSGFTLYAGFSRITFPLEDAGEGADKVDSGVDLGVLSGRPFGGIPFWFRAGVVFHEAETHLESAGGDGQNDGKTGIGVDGGVGVLVRLGRHLAVTPGIGYTAYPIGDPGGATHVRAELGVRVRP